MATAPLEVVGIGNAIVDVIATAEDALLAQLDLAKGTMTLIDEARGEAIYSQMGPGLEMSGGSAGNTMAGFASLGGHGAYIGKVRDDQLGRVFGHDIRALGVRFTTPAANDGPSTARCLVLVTPDAQRTMATYLGACVELGPEDLDRDAIGQAAVTYLEGYLFDPPAARQAFFEAAAIAHANNRQVALTLSDPFCVDRHRAAFTAFIEGHVDILFANEAELKSMAQTDDFSVAMEWLRGRVDVAAITRSEHGSVVLSGDAVVAVPAEPIDKLVDTTGAGDLYAAGFLLGHARRFAPAACAQLGALAAAEVISHVGARPQTSLKALAQTRLPGLSL